MYIKYIDKEIRTPNHILCIKSKIHCLHNSLLGGVSEARTLVESLLLLLILCVQIQVSFRFLRFSKIPQNSIDNAHSINVNSS